MAITFLFSLASFAGIEAAIELAQKNIRKSLQNIELNEFPKIKADIKLLDQAFQLPFEFDEIDCEGEKQGGALIGSIYNLSKGNLGINKIRVCYDFSPSNEELAQFLIHEVSHLALRTFESKATKLEILITYFSHHSPSLNGYTNYGGTWKYAPVTKWIYAMDKDELASLNREWILITGLDNKTAWEAANLNSYVIYGNQKRVLEIIKDYADRKQNILNYQDKFGTTAIMIMVREEKCDMLELILNTNKDIDLSLVNNKGDSALTLAKKKSYQSCKEVLQEYSQQE